jgi:hypothetical protein
MNVAAQLRTSKVDAADILSAAATIRATNANTCYLNHEWTLPATFLDWARRGFTESDAYGLANAITYAKRAAASRIDRLIRNYHLSRLHSANFPRKIEALKEIGIQIPSVIQELIIDPRNELEHNYGPADADVARRAIDIASLFLDSTNDEDNRESVIALNMNILYSHSSNGAENKVTFNGWSGKPMLFIDIFDAPQAVKIVDGKNGDLQYTELSTFSQQQAIQLARILRSHFLLPNHVSSGTDGYFYTELKRQAGF